uniref:Uncharacterized protein n=1 Tax=Trichobilharzia regenti TaxID=157069 RepID=A0AA85JDV7_TRIRE|nr:unnamed protein product [Trichobilharzia regenti]
MDIIGMILCTKQWRKAALTNSMHFKWTLPCFNENLLSIAPTTKTTTSPRGISLVNYYQPSGKEPFRQRCLFCISVPIIILKSLRISLNFNSTQ